MTLSQEDLNRAREGCCADWPKPCTYHEGYQDCWDAHGTDLLDDNEQLRAENEALHTNEWIKNAMLAEKDAEITRLSAAADAVSIPTDLDALPYLEALNRLALNALHLDVDSAAVDPNRIARAVAEVRRARDVPVSEYQQTYWPADVCPTKDRCRTEPCHHRDRSGRCLGA